MTLEWQRWECNFTVQQKYSYEAAHTLDREI